MARCFRIRAASGAAGHRRNRPALTSCAQPGGTPQIELDLPFEHYALANGLEVILRKDDRIPVASVNIWYHVGPANEVEGRRGFAHLFEHMMLQGSGHAPGDYFSRLQAAGATGVNGNTGLDRTAYVQDVPSDQLELALWAESDRMGFLLDALDVRTLHNQQDVIRNERRQAVDNAPYGLGQEEVYRQLFPRSHPYHHYIYGSHADVRSAELGEVRDFFLRYYAPNNAGLAVVGNIDIARTKAMIDKYFATIPRGPDVPEVKVEVPRIRSQKRTVVTDTVELPRVFLAWISPEAFSAGDAQASLAARMLGGGKASRLYRDLVHDLQIAQSVVADQRALSSGSVFQVTATAKPGHTAEELQTAISKVLDRMAAEGPGTRELAAAKASTLAIVVKSLESSDGVANRLNAYNHFLGTPDYLRKDVGRFEAVTPEQVREFVARNLSSNRGVVVHVNPGSKVLPPDPPAPPPPPVESTPKPAPAEPWRNQVPKPIKAPPSRLPVPESFRLENGLTVFLMRRPELPLFTVQVTARSGGADDPEDLPGLASFTSEIMNEGAGDRGAIDIANDVTGVGSTLETGSSREGSWVIAQGLKPHLDSTVGIMSDVVLRPGFPSDEIARVRIERLADLQQQRNQPLTTAFKVMWREQYGHNHPYAHLGLGTEEAIRRIDRDALVRFYRWVFTPKNSALILTGDFTEREARRLAEDHFGDWHGPAFRSAEPPAASPSGNRIFLVDRPGAAQTTLVFAQPGVARRDPDFDKLLLLNAVLGDLFSSRLNQHLREVLGYTYGVDSQLSQSPYPGLLHISMSVDKQQTAASVTETLAVAGRLRDEGIPGGELDDARRAIVRSLPAMFRTNGSTAASIAHLYALGLPQDHFRRLEGRLAAITAQQVGAAARRHLRPFDLKIFSVGDRELIEEPLRALGLGPVAVRDADGLGD